MSIDVCMYSMCIIQVDTSMHSIRLTYIRVGFVLVQCTCLYACNVPAYCIFAQCIVHSV